MMFNGMMEHVSTTGSWGLHPTGAEAPMQGGLGVERESQEPMRSLYYCSASFVAAVYFPMCGHLLSICLSKGTVRSSRVGDRSLLPAVVS